MQAEAIQKAADAYSDAPAPFWKKVAGPLAGMVAMSQEKRCEAPMPVSRP